MLSPPVRVCSVSPGPVVTPLTTRFSTQAAERHLTAASDEWSDGLGAIGLASRRYMSRLQLGMVEGAAPDEIHYVVKHLREHDQISAHLTEKFSQLFDLGIDLEPAAAKTDQALASIRNDRTHRVTAEMAQSLRADEIFSEDNIRKAIMSL